MTDTVAVEQCDRLIAIEVVKSRRGWSNKAVQAIESGNFDGHDAVKAAALARHRLAAIGAKNAQNGGLDGATVEACAKVAENDVPQDDEGRLAAAEAVAGIRIAEAIRALPIAAGEEGATEHWPTEAEWNGQSEDERRAFLMRHYAPLRSTAEAGEEVNAEIEPSQVIVEAQFLVDRISEIDWSVDYETFANDWFGHVNPPYHRLKDLLEGLSYAATCNDRSQVGAGEDGEQYDSAFTISRRRYEEKRAKANAALSTPPADLAECREVLELARPIVEADLDAAKQGGDSDWEGQSYTALEAIDALIAKLGAK